MSTFTAVELSKLPVPDLTEQVSFEQSYADLKATLYLLAPEYAALLESDPMSVLLQVCAYREVHLRESFNVRGKGNMLAYAGGADLDNLGAFFGVVRQQITPAEPKTNTPAVMESDVELRRRIQLAPEGYSVAGPEGAYLFHALSADPDVLDVSAMSPTPGEVLVTLKAWDKPGSPEMVERLRAKLAKVADAQFVVKIFQNGPPIDAPIQLRIIGPAIVPRLFVALRKLRAQRGVRVFAREQRHRGGKHGDVLRRHVARHQFRRAAFAGIGPALRRGLCRVGDCCRPVAHRVGHRRCLRRLRTVRPPPCRPRRTSTRRHIARRAACLRSAHASHSARRSCHKDARSRSRHRQH